MEALPDPFRIFAVLINHSMSVLCAFAANTQARTLVTFWNWSDEAIPHTFEMEVTIMQKLSVLGDSEYHNIQDPLRSDLHIRKTVLISVAVYFYKRLYMKLSTTSTRSGWSKPNIFSKNLEKV